MLVLASFGPAAARTWSYEEIRSGPFEETADASAAIDSALLSARGAGKHVLAVLGGNWCHDSRAFARYLDDAAVKRITDAHYAVVFVDVGRRDRNLDVAARFKAPELTGTPTILILDADGRLLNADATSEWTQADSRSATELAAFLAKFIPKP
jgi:hypothetical protein